jgi:hypothetical protein
MKPEHIGRVMGIGVRVAGRIAGQRVGPMTASATARQQAEPNAQAQAIADKATQTAAQASRGVAQGVGGLLRPFRRVGGILWLEITGAFFLLPVVVFGPNVWRTRASWAAGPDHRTFWASAVVVTVFLYLGVSSFWRANRRSHS